MGHAENAVTKAVKLAIAQMGPAATFIRVQAGSFRVGERFIRGAEAGAADLIGCYRGYPVAIEVKTGKGRQSPTQKEWAERWRSAGGIYAVARSYEDARDLFVWIEGLTHGKDQGVQP